jgi:glucose dehydrogenase
LLAGFQPFDLRAANRDWRGYLADSASSQHSTLNQIHAENVAKLQVTWTYRTGDAREDNRSQIQCNLLVIDGVLYGPSPQLKFFAPDTAKAEASGGDALSAIPSTYLAGGKQFVVIGSGGGKMSTPSGDTYVAFALP